MKKPPSSSGRFKAASPSFADHLRRMGLVAAILFGVFATAFLVGVTYLLDTEQVELLLERELSDKLHRSVEVGAFEWRRFPNATLVDVRIMEPDETSLFAAVGALRVDLSLFDLLSYNITVDRVEFNRFFLTVERTPEGWNIADLLEGEGGELLFESLKLHEGTILVKDGSDSVLFRLDGEFFRTGRRAFDAEVAVAFLQGAGGGFEAEASVDYTDPQIPSIIGRLRAESLFYQDGTLAEVDLEGIWGPEGSLSGTVGRASYGGLSVEGASCEILRRGALIHGEAVFEEAVYQKNRAVSGRLQAEWNGETLLFSSAIRRFSAGALTVSPLQVSGERFGPAEGWIGHRAHLRFEAGRIGRQETILEGASGVIRLAGDHGELSGSFRAIETPFRFGLSFDDELVQGTITSEDEAITLASNLTWWHRSPAALLSLTVSEARVNIDKILERFPDLKIPLDHGTLSTNEFAIVGPASGPWGMAGAVLIQGSDVAFRENTFRLENPNVAADIEALIEQNGEVRWNELKGAIAFSSFSVQEKLEGGSGTGRFDLQPDNTPTSLLADAGILNGEARAYGGIVNISVIWDPSDFDADLTLQALDWNSLLSLTGNVYEQIGGEVEGRVRVRAPVPGEPFITGNVGIAYSVEGARLRGFEHLDVTNLSITRTVGGDFNARGDLSIPGTMTGRFRGFISKEGYPDVRIVSDPTDLSLWNPGPLGLVNEDLRLSGYGAVSLRVQYTPEAMLATGRLDMEDAAAFMPDYNIRFEDLDGTVRITHEVLGDTPTFLSIEEQRNPDTAPTLRVGRVQWQRYSASNVSANAYYKNGQFRMEGITYDLYGGSGRGAAAILTRPNYTRWAFTTGIENCDLRRFFDESRPFAGEVTGFADIQFTAAGENDKVVRLNGSFESTTPGRMGSDMLLALAMGTGNRLFELAVSDFDYETARAKLRHSHASREILLDVDLIGSRPLVLGIRYPWEYHFNNVPITRAYQTYRMYGKEEREIQIEWQGQLFGEPTPSHRIPRVPRGERADSEAAAPE